MARYNFYFMFFFFFSIFFLAGDEYRLYAENSDGKHTNDFEFFSIQASGLTIADGDVWYFEEYDENGNIISTVSYRQEKMLSKSSIEYYNNKKVGAVFVDPKKIIKVKYDSKGSEIKREEFRNKKGETGKILLSYNNVYGGDGRLKEETYIENGVEIRKVYAYKNGEKVTETVYENGSKTIFIEYRDSLKLVHLFDKDTEVSVFEEEIDD